MVLSMCIVPTEIFTDYSELFWDNDILFYCDVGKVHIFTWRVLAHLQLVQTVMWREWRHCITAWSFKRWCRKCTETSLIITKKKTANEYEIYPQKEKLQTTNEE